MSLLNTTFKKINDSLFNGKNYSEEGMDMRQRIDDTYRDHSAANSEYWEQASIDTRFVANDQTVWNELYGIKPLHKPQFSFNRVRRIINMVSGQQRKNRKSIICTPVESGDQQTSDQFTKILSWMARNDGMLETISDGFASALASGMSMLQLWMDYSHDPVSGDLRLNNNMYSSFLLDPYFKKKDLSDCSFLWKRSYLTKDQIKTLMPRKSDKSMLEKAASDQGLDSTQTEIGDKFQYMPEDFFMTSTYDRHYKLYSYDEYYYKTTRKQKMLRDMESGETMEWSGDDSQLKLFINTYPQVRVINSTVSTVKMAVLVDGNVIYDGKNPLGTDSYPFIPIIAYFNPEQAEYSNRIQSIVRDLRDPQYLYNRRKCLELEMLESQVNSGWKYKENALVDPKSIFISGDGRGIALKNSAQMTDVEKIMPGAIPPSVMNLSESLANEITQISGVNEEMLGSAVDDKAGILSMLRQGAGLTILEGLFDNLDYAMKLVGRASISVIQSNFTPGKIQKIIEEQPSQQFFDKSFGKYDAAVEEGVNTTTQRQMQLATYLHLKEVGITIPTKAIINSLTVQNKNELLQAIQEEEQQAQQAQQQQMESEMQLKAAQAELAKARAHADHGLGDERYSRIPENRAMAIANIAEANKDDEQALLNKMKAIAELEDMDLAQLNQLVLIANALKEGEQIGKEGLAKQAGV